MCILKVDAGLGETISVPCILEKTPNELVGKIRLAMAKCVSNEQGVCLSFGKDKLVLVCDCLETMIGAHKPTRNLMGVYYNLEKNTRKCFWFPEHCLRNLTEKEKNFPGLAHVFTKLEQGIVPELKEIPRLLIV